MVPCLFQNYQHLGCLNCVPYIYYIYGFRARNYVIIRLLYSAIDIILHYILLMNLVNSLVMLEAPHGPYASIADSYTLVT